MSAGKLNYHKCKYRQMDDFPIQSHVSLRDFEENIMWRKQDNK